MKGLMLIPVLMAGLSAFAGEAGPPQDVGITIDLTDTPTLGRGYDSRNQNFVAMCVQNSGGTLGPLQPEGSLSARLSSSQDDAATSLGVQAGGRYRTGVTEISASAEFARSTVSSGYSVNFVYKMQSKYNQQYDTTKTDIDIKDGFKGILKDVRNFFFTCGDEYVSSESRAAQLLINLSVSFSSQEEANSFAAEFKLNSPTVGITAAIQNAAKSVSKRTTMTFNSVQLGGSPGLSGKSICADQDGKPTTGTACAEPIIQCGFGKFDQCIQMLEGIVKYSADDFSKQVTDDKGNPKNYAIMKVHVQPYRFANSKFPLPPDESVERVFKQEMDNLRKQFESYFKEWVYADRVLFAGTPRLSPRQKPNMVLIEASLHATVNHLTTNIEECYEKGYDACTKNSSAVAKYLTDQLAQLNKDAGTNLVADYSSDTLDKAIFALAKPESFAQFCDLADDHYPATKVTVESLKAWVIKDSDAVRKGIKFDEGDACAKYETYLMGASSIDLSITGNVKTDLRIASLEPLATLTNLKSLNLSGQSIDDVKPLAKLVNLTDLNLSGNIVKDACPLAQLQQLQSINLQNNQLKSIDCFGKSPSLATIDGRGNSSNLSCPLKAPGICKIKDFTKAITATMRPQNCDVHVGSTAVSLRQGELLVAGGAAARNGFGPVNDLTIYNRDSCMPLAVKLYHARANATMTTLKDGRILIAGGYTNTLEIYSPASLTIQVSKATLSTPRSFHTATLLPDGRVLFVGGYADGLPVINVRTQNTLASFEIYNPAKDAIESAGRLKNPRAEHTATLLNDGRVLILGGYQDSRNLSPVEIIDTAKGIVQTLQSRMQEGRFGHSAQLLNDGRVLIAGGFGWTSSQTDDGTTQWTLGGLATAEIFDPSNESFRKLGDKLAFPRGAMITQVTCDGRVLLIGGNNQGQLYDTIAAYPSPHKDVEAQHEAALASTQSAIDIYDPQTESLYSAGHLNNSRSQMAAAMIDENSLLVIGGFGSNDALVTAELLVYKP